MPFADIQKNYPKIQTLLSGVNVFELVDSAEVIVVDNYDLRVQIEGVSQPCVAINEAKYNRITVHAQRWQEIKNPFAKTGIALHEFLSLVGLEANWFISYFITIFSGRGRFRMDMIKPRQSYSKTHVNCADTEAAVFNVIVYPMVQSNNWLQFSEYRTACSRKKTDSSRARFS